MNPDLHNENDFSDESLSELLGQLDDDAAPIDADALARAVKTGTGAFTKAATDDQATVASDGPSSRTEDRNAEARLRSQNGDRRMLFTIRAILGAAAILVAGISLFFQAEPAAGSLTLGMILDEAVKEQSLQLKVVRDGTTADVWVQDDQVRWDETPGRYRIANGSTLWEIDEDANTLTERTNNWQNEERNIDLLAMLGLDGESTSALRKAQSSGTAQHEGRECSVFRVSTASGGQPLIVEAYVDARSRQLLTIAAWPKNVDPARRVNLPVAELRLIALNVAVDEDRFRIARTLSKDGRIGQTTDTQGLVMLKPQLGQRWTPVTRQMLVRPGDWIRTDVRGANATTVALTSQFEVIVGPGSLIEFLTPQRIRIIRGEAQLRGSAGAEDSLTIDGPMETVDPVSVKAEETVLYRLVKTDGQDALTRIEKKPAWLSGYEGSSSNESLGSLIANVDGRSVPLTVGFHKVKVEIRDQIARTTIEESFVNRTKRRLEGVFHFPLPQDASISGFGMWINGELIEADVVEKQRAREIYETILRERRDPGLLEWTGGNIFKARVFPIEPLSEKRIKIVYTQVLPLRGNKYRYSYGLRSELLQKTPLRELSLDVLVSSEMPLKSVTCPTHPVRTSYGAPIGGGVGLVQSANLEFSAQEYSPDRDFEVVCEVDAKQSDVVVVPHQRGDDGYFLLQLTPPANEGNWQRETIPDGEPLDLLLICDTSGSMDSVKRRQQREFIATVLSSLGPDDRFNIASIDVETEWLFQDRKSGDDTDAKKLAQDWLAGRISLGWTDLDNMLAVVPDQAKKDSHVVYVGDGMPTNADVTSQSFAIRMENLRGMENFGTLHTVSVGSSFETTVLKSLAGISYGSTRSISGGQTPQRVAAEFLSEITRPGLRDIRLSFRGLDVAAVHPETLPNLAAGSQQILVGRYLPTGSDQSGEVVVTGRRGDEILKYAARLNLKDAERGNSFIPRLWARAHLNHLLMQGSSPLIKDEIIAMSEEFHIITPYTSLLVLETDEDRERFGVTRRFQMRDGDRFFADGRNKASFELLQQQMKRAGDWRVNLRHQVLRTLTELGRNSDAAQQFGQWVRSLPGETQFVDLAKRLPEPMSRPYSFTMSGGSAGGYGGFGGGGFGGESLRSSLSTSGRISANLQLASAATMPVDKLDISGRAMFLNGLSTNDELLGTDSEDAELLFDEQLDFNASRQPNSMRGQFLQKASELTLWEMDAKFEASARSMMSTDGLLIGDRRRNYRGSSSGRRGDFEFGGGFPMRSAAQPRAAKKKSAFYGRVWNQPSGPPRWLTRLFPPVPEPAPKPASLKSEWPAEAIELSKSLLQAPDLSDGRGLSITIKTERFDPRWERITHQSQSRQLRGSDRWLNRPQSITGQTGIEWCNATEHGLFLPAFRTGRVRESAEGEAKSTNIGERSYAETPLHHVFAAYESRIERLADNRVRLHLIDRNSQLGHAARITIDTARHVVLKIESLQRGNVVSSAEYSDHQQAFGVWFPGRIERFDEEGRRISTTIQTATELTANELTDAFNADLPDRKAVRLLPMKLATLAEAETAAQDGSAGFEERLILLLNAARIQNHDEVLNQFREIEKLIVGAGGGGEKPGDTDLLPPYSWLQIGVLIEARRFEEARMLLMREASRLVAPGTQDTRPTDDYFLATHLITEGGRLGDANEQLRLIEKLAPVFKRQTEWVNGEWNLKRYRLANLNALRRVEEALALNRELAEAAPWDTNVQTQYAYALATAGDVESGLAWLRAVVDRKNDNGEFVYLEHEEANVRNAAAGLLRDRLRYDDLVEYLADWIARTPKQQTAYRQYLSTLIFADHLQDADDTATQWLTIADDEETLNDVRLAKLNVAIQYALGNRDQLHMSWMEPKWLPVLSRLAWQLLLHDEHSDVASQIIQHHYFSSSDESDELRQRVAKRLQTLSETLGISNVQKYVGWTVGRTDLTTDEWAQLAQTLRERWNGLKEVIDDPAADSKRQDDIESLGDTLTQIYSRHFADTEHLPFLRDRLAQAERGDRPDYVYSAVSRLFEALIALDWSDDNETEAVALIPRLSTLPAFWGERADISPKPATERLADQIAALHRFVDRMLEARYQTADKNLQDTGHPENLTRPELAAKRSEFRKAAYEGLHDQLTESVRIVDNDSEVPQALNEWVLVECMYLDIRLGRNLDEIVEECFELLGDSPGTALSKKMLPGNTSGTDSPADDPGSDASDDDDSENVAINILRGILRERVFETVSYLAVRRSSDDELVDRVLAYVESGISSDDHTSAFWKRKLYSLLIALDRPDQLQQRLREWIRTDEYAAPWQLALGRLLAERGDIDEAITLFETVQRQNSGMLPAGTYSMLADWYLITDQRQRHQRSKIEVFKALEEWQISNWLGQKRQPWYRSDVPLPMELDEDVLFAFQALFEKSSQPGQYLYQLREFYTACRDFRLLRMLPDSVVGRTPQQVYHFLGNLKANLLTEMRAEATADEILTRIEELRARGSKQPDTKANDDREVIPGVFRSAKLTAIDLRALDLLEVLIERQAAEVLNEPGPHIDASVAALRRAFRHEWADGEVRQMANFLKELGRISQQPLADERLRQLRELQKLTTPGTDDHLALSWHLASAMFYSHDVREDAIAVMEIAVREFTATHPDGWPAHGNSQFHGWLELLVRSQRYAQAEQICDRYLENPLNEQQRLWLVRERYMTRHWAIDGGGEVSLGTGIELYRKLLAELVREIEQTSDSNHRREVINRVHGVFRSAHVKKFEGHYADIRQFAYRQLLPVLAEHSGDYSNLANSTAQVVREINGPRDALEFVILAFEHCPARFEYSWNSPWQRFSYRIAQWFNEAASDPGRKALEPRLLAIVLKELRRDLETRYQRSRYLFHHSYGWFWGEKTDDFARVAEEVYAEHRESERFIAHIAEYLYHGLRRFDRAIEMLLIANREGHLSPSTRSGQLVQYLHNRNRHAESIPILEPLIESSPLDMRLRGLLITAYARSNRPQQLEELIAETDRLFRDGGRWTESNISILARAVSDNSLHDHAVKYLNEVIPLHQRTAPNRGIGNSTLPDYYIRLSRAYTGLRDTIKAVDAASSAVVSWGPRHSQRSSALHHLESALRASRDLDAFVKHHDATVEESGQDSPLIRQKLGKVYTDKGQLDLAVVQFKLSLELQPNDVETHKALIASYDRTKDASGAVQATLALLDLDRHNLDQYRKLADRLKDDEALSERALTTIVEAAPNEAEHHHALAELLQKRDRWEDAVVHWKHVAEQRALEPTGLLNLAAAQARLEKWSGVRESLSKLRARSWPQRFSDVNSRISELERRIPKN